MKRSFLVGLLTIGVLSLSLVLGTSCSSSKPGNRSSAQDSTRSASRSRRARRTQAAADTLGRKAKTAASAATGKVARAAGVKGKRGTLQPVDTREERAAERKRLKELKRQARREARRKRQEELMARRAQRSVGRRSRGGKRGSVYDAFMLKATVAGQYALVGTRRVERGDVIAGKKVVDIGSDRIVVEQYGTTTSVRIGEPIDRNLQIKPARR